MDIILNVLKSSTFIESAGLLIFGAIISGIAIPIIKNSWESIKYKNKILHDFIKKFSDLVWKYQYEVLKVSYNRLFASNEQFQAAYQEYDKMSWEILKEIRSLIGSSVWFLPERTYAALIKYYENWIISIDDELFGNIKKDNPLDWKEFHNKIYTKSKEETDQIINVIMNKSYFNKKKSDRPVQEHINHLKYLEENKNDRMIEGEKIIEKGVGVTQSR